MQVEKWGHSLAVRLPPAVVEALNLKEGDEIDIQIVGERAIDVAHKCRDQALEQLHGLRRKLPDGWVFDRAEASER